jgi:ATP-binding cassette subfamily B protein
MKSNLLNLWKHIEARRRVQFSMLLLLMIVASFAEVISIGLVVPFLSVLTSPDQLFQSSAFQQFNIFFNFSNSDQLIFPIVVVFITSAILAGSIRILLLYLIIKFSYTVGADLSINIYRKTLYQKYETHLTRNSSEIINTITNKTNEVVSGIINPILVFLSSIVLSGSIIFALLIININIAISLFLGFGVLYILISKYTKRKLIENGNCVALMSTKIIKLIQEGLGGVRDILLDGSQEFYSRNYHSSDIALRNAAGNSQFIKESPRYIVEAIGMVILALVAYYLISSDEMTIEIVPMLGALALGSQKLIPSLHQIYNSLSSIRSSQASFFDVLALLNQEVEMYPNSQSNNSIIFNNSISLKIDTFQYKSNKTVVLKDVSIVINKGQKIGFIGETGSGKSTLVDIIMGLLTIKNGTMTVDSKVISKENQILWQKNIAHVPQNIFLSDATIEDNIVFGIDGGRVDYDKLIQSTKTACIDEFICKLPDGYKTIVGERGALLSGGQKQRIGIARALYKNSRVLVLDEATSALDSKTEKKVMKSINQINPDITILIIAHRVSTLTECDQIFELSNKTCLQIDKLK